MSGDSRRWLALLELAYETVLVRSFPGDRILYWNAGAEARYGWTAAEALGRDSHVLLRTRAAEPLDRIAAELAASGRWEGELKHETRTGQQRTMEVRWALWHDTDTGRDEVLEIGRDVTELRRAEAEHQRLEEKALALQRLESLGGLAAGVAHDFNNLVMAMVANADLARLQLPDDHRAARHLEQIAIAARHAGEITDRLRDYAGERRRVREPTRLDVLVGEVAEMLRASLAEGVELELVFRSQAAVPADAVALRQVFLNLLANASEASVGGGRIRVVVEDAQRTAPFNGSLLLDPGRPGPYVVVSISDDGPGIDAPDRGRIFEPFFSTKRGGRGLGLPLVIGMVKAHAGGLALESRPGAGSTFTVLLPATAD